MKKAALPVLMLGAAFLFAALGVWQVERLAWKRDLMAQTELKLAAEAVAAPLPSRAIGPEDAYTKVWVSGTFVVGKDAFVVASTRLGRGFWVMTPLQTDGFVVLVNRGFVASAQRAALVTPQGTVRVEGLLRLTEPEGSLLQRNEPLNDRWFSRDVAAIGVRQGLNNLAPYFVDAAVGSEPVQAGGPVAGLTVVQFRNNHLQYALTWFGLALLCLVGLSFVVRDGLRR